MAVNVAVLTAGAQGIADTYPYLSLHNGSGETSAARQAANWVVSGGALTATNVAFTGGTGSGEVAEVHLWTAETGGTDGDGEAFAAPEDDTSFNAAGEYTVDSLTLTGGTQ
ncbi:MAG: hypothetical protein ACRDQA_14245 [Nocardioidaceae bacterium]